MKKQKKTLKSQTITPGDQQRMLETLDNLRAFICSMQVSLACPSCDHFDNDTSFCSEHGDTVPVDFRPKGCDKWSDKVPF